MKWGQSRLNRRRSGLCFGGRPFDAAADRRGDLPLEACPAERPSAVRGRTQLVDKIRIERRAEQLEARLLPFDRINPEPVEQLVSIGQPIDRSPRSVARPRIIARMPEHSGPHRIELDVAAACEKYASLSIGAAR
jgi:hypothetical protein